MCVVILDLSTEKGNGQSVVYISMCSLLASLDYNFLICFDLLIITCVPLCFSASDESVEVKLQNVVDVSVPWQEKAL